MFKPNDTSFAIVSAPKHNFVKGMDVVCALERGDKLVSAKVLRKRNRVYKPEVTPGD